MTLPKGKPTKKQAKQIEALRPVLANFARMFDLSTRCKQQGLDACAIIGCTRFNAPTAETITEEQFAKIQAAVEAAEAKRTDGLVRMEVPEGK